MASQQHVAAVCAALVGCGGCAQGTHFQYRHTTKKGMTPSTQLTDRYDVHRLNYAAVVMHNVELSPAKNGMYCIISTKVQFTGLCHPSPELVVIILQYAVIVAHDIELLPTKNGMIPSTYLNDRYGRRRPRYAAVVVHDVELTPTKNAMTPSTYLNICRCPQYLSITMHDPVSANLGPPMKIGVGIPPICRCCRLRHQQPSSSTSDQASFHPVSLQVESLLPQETNDPAPKFVSSSSDKHYALMPHLLGGLLLLCQPALPPPRLKADPQTLKDAPTGQVDLVALFPTPSPSKIWKYLN
ncbi:hypothetical protein B0H14DRAFT_3473539 [Mycena olivaceomarginata]|nr:hypothetical protein B0H14DRAFT_3473539 [Mycena olivaceomarginata]